MNKLRELRLEQGLSLRDLADKLDLSYSSIGKYERDEAQPSFEILYKIADFFDVTIDYLIGFSNVKKHKYAEINEEIGLTDKSIQIIKQKKTDIAIGLNSFIQNPLFLELMELYAEYSILIDIPSENLEDITQTSYGYDSFDFDNPLDSASRNLLERLEKLSSAEAYRMYILNLFSKLLDNTKAPTD